MERAVIEEQEALPAWVDNGVLITGPRKGGTTLFQNLLDGSEQMLVYPHELKLKGFVRNPRRMDSIDAYHAMSRIPRVEWPHFSLERYQELWDKARERRTLKGIAEFVRYDAWAVHESCTRPPADPRMWATKEVGREIERIIPLWRKLFPGARILLVTRDPVMVTRAVLNDRRRKDVRLSPFAIARETLEPMRVATAQSRMLDAPDIHAVAYEDIVADTPGIMAGVARFLGLPPSPIFERPTTFREPVVVRTASQKTTSVFRAGNAWQEGLTRREIAVVLAVRTAALRLPRYNVDYAALRQRLRDRSPQ